MNTLPPNGGFLASWGPGGDWSGTPGEGSPTDPRPRNPMPLAQASGNSQDFQTAGGAGGGFTNFSSWLQANPNQTQAQVSAAAGQGPMKPAEQKAPGVVGNADQVAATVGMHFADKPTTDPQKMQDWLGFK